MSTLTTDVSAAQALVASANEILHQTPDPEWWSLRPAEVVAFAFPDYDLVAVVENANLNQVTVEMPRALLRSRTNDDEWLLIWSHGKELLPGRASTMGQFFRFKDDLFHNHFAVGSPDQIVARVERQYRRPHQHNDTAGRSLYWWLLDTLYPDPRTEAIDPLYRLFTDADHRLHFAAGEGPFPAGIEALTVAFPAWVVAGLTESAAHNRTRALLRHGHSDRWLYLDKWAPTLVPTAVADAQTAGLPVFRDDNNHSRRVRASIGTSADLVATQRQHHRSFPTSTDLWWLLWHLGRAMGDTRGGIEYRNEAESTFTLLGLEPRHRASQTYSDLAEFINPPGDD